MTGKKEKAKFIFFKYVPPKKGQKPFKEEEYSQKTGGREELSELVPDVPVIVEESPVTAKPVKTEEPEQVEDTIMTEETVNVEDEVKKDEEQTAAEAIKEDIVSEEPEEVDLTGFPEPPKIPDYPCVPEPPECPDFPKEPCPENAVIHVIQAGDTFWKLAKKYNTTVESISIANPEVDPLNLQIGQTICIPLGIPGAKG